MDGVFVRTGEATERAERGYVKLDRRIGVNVLTSWGRPGTTETLEITGQCGPADISF